MADTRSRKHSFVRQHSRRAPGDSTAPMNPGLLDLGPIGIPPGTLLTCWGVVATRMAFVFLTAQPRRHLCQPE